MKYSINFKSVFLVILIIALPFIDAVSYTDFNPLKAIPEGAFAVISIPNSSLLIENTQLFLDKTGLDEASLKFKNAIEKIFEPNNPDKQKVIKTLNFNKPVVMAFYMEQDESIGTVIFFPVNNTLTSLQKSMLMASLIEETKAQDIKLADNYPSYIVIALDYSPKLAYGLGPVMNYESFSKQSLTSINIWLSTKNIAKQKSSIQDRLGSFFGNEQIKEAADDSYMYYEEDYDWNMLDNDSNYDTNTIKNDNTQKSFSGSEDMFNNPQTEPDNDYELLEKIANELSSIKLTLNVQKDRAWFNIELQANPGGKLAYLATEASKGQESLPWLKYCNSNSLFSWAWSMPQDWPKSLLNEFLGSVLLDSIFNKESMNSFMPALSGVGMNGAGSFNLTLSTELLSAIKNNAQMDEDKTIELITKGVNLKLSSLLELTDRQIFRDTLASTVKIFNEEFIQNLLAANAVKMSIEQDTGIVSGKLYDSYNYSIEAVDDTGKSNVTSQILAKLLPKLLKPVYIYSEDKAFLGLGSPKKVAGDFSELTLYDRLISDKAFNLMREGVPTSARALLYISTKELMNLLISLQQYKNKSYAYNIKALSGLLLWLDAEPNSLGLGFGIGAEDIKALMSLPGE